MWTREFEYSTRHCFPDNDGKYRIASSFDEFCNNPEEHPYQAGTTEFLRWIREFAILVPGIVTNFEDGFLKLGPDIMYDGTSCYCENYGGIVKAFLNPDEGWAKVEIGNEYFELYSSADLAVISTTNSYKVIA
jgi:hypothetical protein